MPDSRCSPKRALCCYATTNRLRLSPVTPRRTGESSARRPARLPSSPFRMRWLTTPSQHPDTRVQARHLSTAAQLLALQTDDIDDASLRERSPRTSMLSWWSKRNSRCCWPPSGHRRLPGLETCASTPWPAWAG
jgi:hypothetical protein